MKCESFVRYALSILYLYYFSNFMGITVASSVDYSKDMDLHNIRQIVQENEKYLNLIKMNYVVRYDDIEARNDMQFGGGKTAHLSNPLTHKTGTWAQNGIQQHSSYDFYDVDPDIPSRSEISIINGELAKWGKRPDLMTGIINKVEDYNWRNRIPNRLGIRPFEGELLLSELLIPKYATILEKNTIFNGQNTCLVEIKRHKELVYYARVWIDKKRGIPLRYVYFMKLDSNQEDILEELLITKTHSLPNNGVLPVETKRTRYRGNVEKNTFSSIDVNSVTIKQEDIPDSLFDIEFPEGAEIFDGITGINLSGPGMLDMVIKEGIRELILDNNDNVTSNLTSELLDNAEFDVNSSIMTIQSNNPSSDNLLMTTRNNKYGQILVLLSVASIICIVMLWILCVKIKLFRGKTK